MKIKIKKMHLFATVKKEVFYKIWFILFLMVLMESSCQDSNPIRTIDIYKGEYFYLMKAVQKEDIATIEQIVADKKLNLNYADAAHGVSLLNWCIFSKRLKAFEELLILGANPNWQDPKGEFAPPITEAAKLPETDKYLKVCLKYRGDPNCISKKIKGTENQTPLYGSFYSDRMENIKILIANGANVNLAPEGYWTPLAELLVQDKIVMAKFLIDQGADYIKMNFKTESGNDLNILDLLRMNKFNLNSEEYKIKMEIVEFLKKKGLDYWKYPIPDDIKLQYKNDPDYLDKY